MGLREVLQEIMRTWTGRIGFTLLVIQAALAVFVVLTTDYPRLSSLYLDENAWIGKYPVAVPPCWAVSKRADVIEVDFRSASAPPTMNKTRVIGRFVVHNVTWEVVFQYRGDAPPSDTLMLVDVERGNATKAVKVSLVLERPDGLLIPLLLKKQVIREKEVLIGVGAGKPLTLDTLKPESRIYHVILDTVSSRVNISVEKLKEMGPGTIIWLGGNGDAVKGEYKLHINLFYVSQRGAPRNESLVNLRVYVKTLPNCYGLMGTDSVGRPVDLGILLGLPWSFIISLYVSFLAVLIGGFYGIIAGIASGWKAELLMRIADVVYSLPFLPILIVVIVVTGNKSIWLITSLMVALFWVSPVVVVRSMTLQIKEQPYIETARAVGVGTLRIIFRYIFPQVLPYLVAQMVLGIPDPILTEAALAFLGLSDPTVPTWGKMLEYAWMENAVTRGLWWDFIFPGLALSIFCASFLMLGRALEPIVSPRMRRG